MLRSFKKFFVAALLCLPLFAEPDNGKFLPDPEIFLANHVFFEVGGGMNFPLEFFNQGTIPMTSYGGHFFASVDYNWSGWLFGLEYTHDMWGEGQGQYSLMENFRTNIIELTVRKIISKKAVKWFPKWLEVIPGLGIGVNFITTDYYPSVRAKEEGRLNSVTFGQPGANCLFYNGGLELAVRTGNDMFIPFIGADYNAFYDVSIGGGFAGYPRVYAGIRFYPFGVVNNIQEAIEEYRENKEQAAFAGNTDETEEAEEQDEETFELVEGKVFIGVNPSIDFTPDDDGVNDKVTITPSVQNIGNSVEKWTIRVLDQKVMNLSAGVEMVRFQKTLNGTENQKLVNMYSLATLIQLSLLWFLLKKTELEPVQVNLRQKQNSQLVFFLKLLFQIKNGRLL